MDFLIHIGMALYLVSYTVRDILWLRVVTVIASVALVVAYTVREDPLITSAVWCFVFAAVNVAWIAKLLAERRPVQLSEEEERVYEKAFPSLSRREARSLMDFARWQDAEVGDVLIEEDLELERLLVISCGSASCSVGGEVVQEMPEGRILGEVSFLTDGKATARVTASLPTRYAWWDATQFRAFMNGSSDRRSALLIHLSTDAARKLASR